VRGVVSKILMALHDANGTSQTTQYMVRQLVRRISYLLCTDTAAIQKQAGSRENGNDVDGRGDSTDSSGNGGAIRIHVDYTLDSPLIAAALQVVVEDELTGAVPRTDIFNRSVQRRKAAPPRRHAGTKILREIYSDDDTEVEGAVVHFSSALHAARELVLENVMYGNSDVDEIDMGMSYVRMYPSTLLAFSISAISPFSPFLA
jgi:hypothetical protein